MLTERRRAIQEEVSESETSAELEAMVRHWGREFTEAIEDKEIMGWVDFKRQAFAAMPVVVEDPQAQLKALLDQLAKLKGDVRPIMPPVQRATRKYRLLKTEVTWSTKPQVLAVMHIIAAHAKPGDVLDESDIVNMMVANEHVLNTKQGGKRIWDYYKGNHNEGLVAHGHFERI
jgi:hypothetical protein